MEFVAWLVGSLARELTLFAAVGLLIGGLDDLVIDLIWLGRSGWRRFVIFRRHARVTLASLPAPVAPGRIVVFVAAWHEAAVIGAMLRAALARWGDADFRIYVGCYPNDPDTRAAIDRVAADDPRVRGVGGTIDGPTSKAECLNRIWRRLQQDEAAEGWRAKAVVLHDAEDVVHPGELKLFDALIERFAMIQLPVLPLPDAASRWVSGVYLDEFAEAHAKQLIVREALGAGVPSAGVGCAFSRAALVRIAAASSDGLPFDATSLTEDYEVGLRLARAGARGVFVNMPAAPGAPPVAVRAYFPGSFTASRRQKTRWLTGIALDGWDRLGWRGSIAERWMRLRDRRAILAALVLSVAYAALILWPFCLLLGVPVELPPVLLWANSGLLVWRLVLRAWVVNRYYGWREALRSGPRIVIGNIVAIAAARAALFGYVASRERAWDKTQHHFPSELPCD